MNVHRDGRGTDVAGPIRHNWPTGPFYNLTECACFLVLWMVFLDYVASGDEAMFNVYAR